MLKLDLGRGKVMTWRDIERVIKDEFEVIVEQRWNRNKYWIKREPAYFEISSLQFDRLLEGGYIDPDYRVGHNCGEQLIYRGR